MNCDSRWHPSGVQINFRLRTGGVASLDPRLISGTPTGVHNFLPTKASSPRVWRARCAVVPGPRSARRGWTLIELLVVLSVAAVMMGLGVTTIHLLLGSEHEAMKSVRYSSSLTRLARVFREDVH